MNKKPIRIKHNQKSKRSLFKLIVKIGLGILLMVFAFSCARIPGLKEEASGPVIKVPFVRVLIDDSQSKISVGSKGSFAVECLDDGHQNVVYANKSVKVENIKGYLTVRNSKGQLINQNLDEVNIIPRGNNKHLSYNKKPYRGIVKLIPAGNNLSVINILYMEDYLRGVVPPEIGKRSKDEIEAVKAQAIAARTYAMAHLKQYPDEQYDMRSSIIDQVYEGIKVEQKLINEAIDATAGYVITYQDDFINAYYHSTCGGMTDDIEDVWDRKEVPYLKAVSDSSACSWSKYYNWEEIFTEKQLRNRIEQYLSSDRGRDMRIGNIKDIVIVETSPGGRITKLVIETNKDRFFFKKDRIRWVFGRTSNPDLILPSNRFKINLQRNSNGKIEKIIFTGSGYGHGVGMCQCGAIGLARVGWNYDHILKHYYKNVEIKKLY